MSKKTVYRISGTMTAVVVMALPFVLMAYNTNQEPTSDTPSPVSEHVTTGPVDSLAIYWHEYSAARRDADARYARYRAYLRNHPQIKNKTK